MGAMSVHVPLPQSVTEVEALACRHAVSFAIDLGLHEVIFEGDYAVVIRQSMANCQALHCMDILWTISSI